MKKMKNFASSLSSLFGKKEEQNDYDEFLYCWTQVANRYKDVSEKVVFELLNEPWYTDGKAQTYLSDSRLNTMQAEAVKIIRNTGSKNADRLIILCTADGNKAWKLDKLVLPDDDNIAVAIHEYSPYDFTHQNFSWAGLGGKTTTLAEQGGFASATSYDFGQIKKFMASNPQVPIIMNEFGLNLSKASAADAREYLSGITSFCKENNIPTTNNQVDIGVRVELPATVFAHITDELYESKIVYRTKQYGDKVRTFCTNPSGEVATEYYDNGLAVVNGHAYKSKDLKTNNTYIYENEENTYENLRCDKRKISQIRIN